MTVYDFSSGFNLLNQGINSLGEALNNRTNAQAYSGIGSAMQQGDWEGAAARAWAMGNPDLAYKLQMQAYAMKGGGYQPLDSSGAPAPAALPPAKTDGDATQPAAKAPADTAAPGTAQPMKGLPSPGGRWAPPGGSANDVQSYIYNAAMARGIDPMTAIRVAHSEWGKTYSGDNNMSFGPFQLYTGGGLGNEFTKTTGLNPADPTTWKQQVDFALDTAARKGSWADWHGAANTGIPNNAGLANARPLGVSVAGPAGAALGPGSAQLPTQPAGTRFGAGGFAGVGAPTAPGAAPAAVASAAPAAPQLAQAPPVAPVPAIRPPTAQAYAGIPLNAPEQGVDAAARALATNLPGAPSPQQQAAAAANPPGLGDLLGLLRGQPNAPAAPQPPAPGQSPGANIPAAYGQPQPATPPAPAGPAAQLQPIVQALQSGRLTMRDLLANPQGFGLPDPRQAASQPVWQVLAQAASGTGRGVGQGPPTPAMGAQAFAGAIPTATSTGEAPQPPVRPQDSQPPPQMAASLGPDESQAGRGPGRNALEDARAGRLPGYPENAPLPPVRPADIGRPFPQPAPPAPPPPPVVPAAIQPRSSRVPTPQGPFGPPGGPGSAFARDFAPGGGQMWGPSGGVMASGAGGITPAYLGGPTPQNITPAARAAQLNAFALPQPGRGAVPAGLPPGAGGAPAGGGTLGGRLAGLGGGLLNLLSMTPPGGVPGLPSPAQYLQGGQGAPVPGPPMLQRPPGAMLPGGGTLPMIQPGAGAGAPAAAPAAAGGAPGTPVAPAGPMSAIDQQIDQATRAMVARRQQASQASFFNPAQAKLYEDEANKYQELVNNLVQKKAEAGLKTGGDVPGGEIGASAQAEMAKKQFENIGTAYGALTDPGGPKGLLSNVYQMKADLNAGAIQGWGGAQGIVQHLGETLAALDLVSSGKVANTQQIQDLAPQEVMRLARMLVGKNRLTNKDIGLLQQGQLNLAQRPEVINGMLDMAAKMANDQIDTHNTAVDRFAEANPVYGNSAKVQFKFDKSTLPKPEDFKAVGDTSKTGTGAAGAVKVQNLADIQKLPPDTLYQVPDGRFGRTPAAGAQ